MRRKKQSELVSLIQQALKGIKYPFTINFKRYKIDSYFDGISLHEYYEKYFTLAVFLGEIPFEYCIGFIEIIPYGQFVKYKQSQYDKLIENINKAKQIHGILNNNES